VYRVKFVFEIGGLVKFEAPIKNIYGRVYIVTVSFIGGGNRNTWRKSPTCRKSLTNFIT
jgi:hypothetical protein